MTNLRNKDNNFMKKIISITLFVFLFGCTTPNERLDEGIRNDNTKEVKEAISKGANVNVSIEDYGSPLTWASEKGYEKIVELLMSAGANVNAKKGREFKETALAVASRKGYIKIVKLLLDKGADVNIRDKDGDTALSEAISGGGYIEIVKLLLDKGANPNLSGNITPIIVASEKGYAEIIKLLLSAGADVNAKNKHGDTALMVAATKGYTAIVNLLLSKGANKRDLKIVEERKAEENKKRAAEKAQEEKQEKIRKEFCEGFSKLLLTEQGSYGKSECERFCYKEYGYGSESTKNCLDKCSYCYNFRFKDWKGGIPTIN